MQLFARATLLVAAALLLASCSDGDARLATQPSAIGTASVVVSATAADVVPDPEADPVCPPAAPSKLSFAVIVTAQGLDEVTITRVGARFTDTTGRQSAQVTLPMLPVTLPGAGPTAMFGVPNAAFARTFPMTLELGCDIGTRGSVVVIVEGSDKRGRRVMEHVTIAVR